MTNIMENLLNDKDAAKMPKVGDIVKVKVISVGKNEVYVDLEGLTGGLIRGKELMSGVGGNEKLKIGDELNATVLRLENEKGVIELSLRSAEEQKMWENLEGIRKSKTTVEVKVVQANKGGLMVELNGVVGFMPVSQLSQEHYPRVEDGSKAKILEKLRKLVGKKIKANVIDVNEEEEKIVFSEKEVYLEDKKVELNKFKEGDEVTCRITGIVNFGVFVEFGEGLEGLIHISELAWQRIENPKDLFKVGDEIKAQIIGIDGERVTLSAKKLIEDPWKKAIEKYKVEDKIKGKVLKIDKFGVFVELDKDIHGLVHVSELEKDEDKKIEDSIEIGKEYEFKILSIEPEEHRLGLTMKK